MIKTLSFGLEPDPLLCLRTWHLQTCPVDFCKKSGGLSAEPGPENFHAQKSVGLSRPEDWTLNDLKWARQHSKKEILWTRPLDSSFGQQKEVLLIKKNLRRKSKATSGLVQRTFRAIRFERPGSEVRYTNGTGHDLLQDWNRHVCFPPTSSTMHLFIFMGRLLFWRKTYIYIYIYIYVHIYIYI